ncbi:hypothetical protein EDC04DRAFT_2614505 [Pisolithus marmoratus]|nr:hypothetical protein EDC04DRAFT_2614505 [Pisolithus marmoratus]
MGNWALQLPLQVSSHGKYVCRINHASNQSCASSPLSTALRPLSWVSEALLSMIFRLVDDFAESPDLDINTILSRLPSPAISDLLVPHMELEDLVLAAVLHTHNDDCTSSVTASDTIYKPDAYHGPNIFSAVAVNNQYMTAALQYLVVLVHFFELLHERVYDCTIQLDTLARSNFKLDIHVIIEVVHHMLFSHHRSQNNPSWLPVEAFRSSMEDTMFHCLFFEELENIGLLYLMHVWNMINHLLRVPPTPSAMPRYSINLAQDDSMHNLLYHALLQPNSTNWISVVEVATGANNSNIMVIVELQELTGGYGSIAWHAFNDICSFHYQMWSASSRAHCQAAEVWNHSLGGQYGLCIIPGQNSFLIMPNNISHSMDVSLILHPASPPPSIIGVLAVCPFIIHSMNIPSATQLGILGTGGYIHLMMLKLLGVHDSEDIMVTKIFNCISAIMPHAYQVSGKMAPLLSSNKPWHQVQLWQWTSQKPLPFLATGTQNTPNYYNISELSYPSMRPIIKLGASQFVGLSWRAGGEKRDRGLGGEWEGGEKWKWR